MKTTTDYTDEDNFMFNFGIESVAKYGPIAYYGHIWHVIFYDWTEAIIVEDSVDSPESNYIFEPEAYENLN